MAATLAFFMPSRSSTKRPHLVGHQVVRLVEIDPVDFVTENEGVDLQRLVAVGHSRSHFVRLKGNVLTILDLSCSSAAPYQRRRGRGAVRDSVGVAINSVVALLQFVADSDTLQQIVFWRMGSFSRSTWPKIAIVAVVLVIALPISLRNVWKLTALRDGAA